MDIEDYISSGNVELYVLGLSDNEQKLKFEQMLLLHPELNAAVVHFEKQLEKFAAGNAVEPPVYTWNNIQDRINYKSARKILRNIKQKNDDGYIKVESQSNSHIRVHKHWKTTFIIVALLLKVFIFFSIYYYLQYRHASEHLHNLQQRVKQMEQTR